jgi:hypothetical protein
MISFSFKCSKYDGEVLQYLFAFNFMVFAVFLCGKGMLNYYILGV